VPSSASVRSATACGIPILRGVSARRVTQCQFSQDSNMDDRAGYAGRRRADRPLAAASSWEVLRLPIYGGWLPSRRSAAAGAPSGRATSRQSLLCECTSCAGGTRCAPQRRTFRLLGLTTEQSTTAREPSGTTQQRLASDSCPGQVAGGNAWYRHAAGVLARYGVAVSLGRVPRVSPAGCNMSNFGCGSEMQILMPVAQSEPNSAVEQRTYAQPWIMQALDADLLTTLIGAAPPSCTMGRTSYPGSIARWGDTADYSWWHLCGFN
jgi:hypothetical protein